MFPTSPGRAVPGMCPTATLIVCVIDALAHHRLDAETRNLEPADHDRRGREQAWGGV